MRMWHNCFFVSWWYFDLLLKITPNESSFIILVSSLCWTLLANASTYTELCGQVSGLLKSLLIRCLKAGREKNEIIAFMVMDYNSELQNLTLAVLPAQRMPDSVVFPILLFVEQTHAYLPLVRQPSAGGLQTLSPNLSARTEILWLNGRFPVLGVINSAWDTQTLLT